MAEDNPISYRVQWLLDNRIIYITAQGNLSEEELFAIDSQVLALFEASTAEQVHLVTNVTDLKNAPGIPILMRQKLLQHPRRGWYITVGANALIRFLGAATGRLAHVNFQFVRTLSEAQSQLQRIDDTLPDLTTAFAALEDDDA